MVKRIRRRLLGFLLACTVGPLVLAVVHRAGEAGRLLTGQPHGPSALATVSVAPAGVFVARGHGWTSAGLQGPVPAPGSCHYRVVAGGERLPDPRCAPGSSDSLVTQANLRSTVCRPGGYTSSVRPPESLTEPVKRRVMAAYGIPWSQASRYELDHLIELNAGGSSDLRNLWPEPNTLTAATGTAFIHNDKDQIESYTFHALCAGKTRLGALQAAIARNWTTAVSVLGLPAIPKGYTG